jgi:hypothetical protein
MRITLISMLAALLTTALVAGCGSRKPIAGNDGAPGGDGISWPDLWPTDGRPVVRDLGVRGRDLVVSKITLPNTTTAAVVGVDYNGDGTVDNALGSILGALSGISGSTNMQGTIDGAVNSGATLMLMRLLARNYTNEPTAQLWNWTARQQKCCSTPSAPLACRQQALAGCFNGKHTFTPIQSSASQLSGSIKGGALRFGPGPMRLRFALSGYGVLDLTLKAAHVRGHYDGKGIRDAVLAGVLDKNELNNKLVPAIAVMLTTILKDASVDKTTKDTIRTLFDANNDGIIATTEVANNALIKTFLAGDVDVDKDGSPEISLGLLFSAVPAVIKP